MAVESHIDASIFSRDGVMFYYEVTIRHNKILKGKSRIKTEFWGVDETFILYTPVNASHPL